MIVNLTEQIVVADRELRSVAKKDDCCPRLMSVPGVGPTTAVGFKATLDVVERFKDAHHVQAYLGLTPGENASSDTEPDNNVSRSKNASDTNVPFLRKTWTRLLTRSQT